MARAKRKMTKEDAHYALWLVRMWTAGCGDDRFSMPEQCDELVKLSGDFLAKFGPWNRSDELFRSELRAMNAYYEKHGYPDP